MTLGDISSHHQARGFPWPPWAPRGPTPYAPAAPCPQKALPVTGLRRPHHFKPLAASGHGCEAAGTGAHADRAGGGISPTDAYKCSARSAGARSLLHLHQRQVVGLPGHPCRFFRQASACCVGRPHCCPLACQPLSSPSPLVYGFLGAYHPPYGHQCWHWSGSPAAGPFALPCTAGGGLPETMAQQGPRARGASGRLQRCQRGPPPAWHPPPSATISPFL